MLGVFPVSQRSYATNIDFEKTLNDPRKIDDWNAKLRTPERVTPLQKMCSDFKSGEKGNATFHLKEVPSLRVQITVTGVVMIFGGTRKDDDQILRLIAACVVTKDSKPFTAELRKDAKGMKEILEGFPLEKQKSVLKESFNVLDQKLKGLLDNRPESTFRNNSNHDRGCLQSIEDAREVLALTSKIDGMDSDTVSAMLERVREAISRIDNIRAEYGMHDESKFESWMESSLADESP